MRARRCHFPLCPAALLVLAVGVPTGAAAQVCWWRPSLQRCDALLLTEVAVSAPLVNTRAEKRLPDHDGEGLPMDAFKPEASWEFALLWVLDERTAVGPSVQYGFSFAHAERSRRLGIRARRQMTAGLALEANAGVIRGHAGDAGDRQRPAEQKVGPSVEVRVNVEDILALRLRYDQLPWRDNTPEQRSIYPDGNARALSGVVSVGARSALPVTALLLAVIALYGGISG